MPDHGLSGYTNRRCRCAICRKAAKAYREQYRGPSSGTHGPGIVVRAQKLIRQQETPRTSWWIDHPGPAGFTELANTQQFREPNSLKRSSLSQWPHQRESE